MPNEQPAMQRGKKDSVLDDTWKFVVVIEGGLIAPDEETVRAYCLANISFTAGFGQQVGNITVAAKRQELPGGLKLE